MGAQSPEGMHDLFAKFFNSKDIEGLLTLYEDENEARNAVFTRKVPFLLHLQESARGLLAGAREEHEQSDGSRDLHRCDT